VLSPLELGIGAVAAFLIGLSKTGLPGSALVALPLVALIAEGRLIPGATLPLLLVADLFAVHWYRRDTRWDILGALAPWIGVGYAGGITFFVLIGSASRQLEAAIGVVLLVIVIAQLRRTMAEPNLDTSLLSTAAHGAAGGFTTFVANAAGPVLNTHLASRGLDKVQLLGTAAWLYFGLNLSKIPFYLALGTWSEGGPFFTVESLIWDAALIPAIVIGVFAGRRLQHRIPQRAFLIAVLVLSAAGAVALIF
jgi:uncharacterized membrane protein YfcA